MRNKWMYQILPSSTWSGEEYDNREECIKEALKELKEIDFKNPNGDKIEEFEIGQVEQVVASGVQADSIVEQIAIDTTDELGDYADDYLEDVKKEHFEELEDSMNKVLFDWMDKYGYNPHFFKIVNLEGINIDSLIGGQINE